MLAYAQRMATAAEQVVHELAQELHNRGIGTAVMARAIGKKYPSSIDNLLKRWPISAERHERLTYELKAWVECAFGRCTAALSDLATAEIHMEDVR
jgi:hypothetical protein